MLMSTAMPKQSNKPKRNDKAVKIERDLAVKAALIAEQLGFDSMAEYLSSILRPLIEKDWPKALKALDGPPPPAAGTPNKSGGGRL